MNRNIKILLTCSIFIHAAHNFLAPIYAIFMERIGGTLFDAGFAIGIYALLKGVCYFLASATLQKVSSRKFLVFFGYLLFALGYSLYLFAQTPYHVFAIQALLAIAETIMNPAWSAIIATSLEKGREVHIYSHFYGYRSIFEGIAAILGGIFVMQMGFDLVFLFMTGFALAASILSLALKEEKQGLS